MVVEAEDMVEELAGEDVTLDAVVILLMDVGEEEMSTSLHVRMR